jgi:uncharacterized protein YbjT (DUF2867 family)
MILVVGATGLLGGRIVRKLLDQEKEVRILIRPNSPCEELALQGRATSAQSLIAAGAQPVSGDLTDPASLEKAVEGVDTVLTTAAATLRDFDIENVDLKGTKNLIDAAKKANVKHFIYTSAFISNPESPIPVPQIKGLCEQYLIDSGLPYTILAPGTFMEIWIPMVVGMPLQAGMPVSLVGKGDKRHSYVAIDDVAGFGAAVVDNPAAINQKIPIGGPASYSWTEVVGFVGKALGKELPITYLSFEVPIPLLPPGVDDILRGMETYETSIDMDEQVSTYGVELTSIHTIAQRIFAPTVS